jgi:hypothetical protein
LGILLCQLHVPQCLIPILQVCIGTGKQSIGLGAVWGIFDRDFELVDCVVVLALCKQRVSQPEVECAIIGGELQGRPILTGGFDQHGLSPVSGGSNHVNIS